MSCHTKHFHQESAIRAEAQQSAVPKRGHSKRGRMQTHANERKRAQTQVRKRVQKSAKGRKRALPRKICKQPGLKQPGLGTPKKEFGNSQVPTFLPSEWGDGECRGCPGFGILVFESPSFGMLSELPPLEY